MSTPDSEVRASSYDPASMPASSLLTSKVVWYRRPWFLIVVVVVVAIAVSVLSDLPHAVSKSEDAAQQNGTITLINNDIAPCTYALHESFLIYNRLRSGTLSAENLQQAPNLLTEDEASCTLASGPIYDLTNNIQPVDTAAGKKIDAMYSVVITWTTNDAKDAIFDISMAVKQPKNTAWVHDLTIRQRYLAQDRARINQLVAEASRLVGVQLKTVNVPRLAPLLGT